MPVSDVSTIASYTVSASTGPWAFAFGALDVDHVKVTLDGVDITSGCTVTLNPDPTPGGSVTSGTPRTGTLVVYRDAPLERTTDYVESGALAEQTIDDDQDYQTMIVQQLRDLVALAPKYPRGSIYANMVFPDPVAGSLLGWVGTVLSNVNVGSVALAIPADLSVTPAKLSTPNPTFGWNATGFGIGIASPTQMLHVRKDQNAATIVRVENQNAGVSATAEFYMATGTAGSTRTVRIYDNGGTPIAQDAVGTGVAASVIDAPSRFWRSQAGVNKMALASGLILYGAAGALPTGGDPGIGGINVAGGYFVNGAKVGADPVAQTAFGI